jgi:hypothetical protein
MVPAALHPSQQLAGTLVWGLEPYSATDTVSEPSLLLLACETLKAARAQIVARTHLAPLGLPIGNRQLKA